MLLTILVCVTINSAFLCLLITAIRLGWVTPALTQSILAEFTNVMQMLVENSVHREVAAKRVAISREIDTKLNAHTAALKMAMKPVSVVYPSKLN